MTNFEKDSLRRLLNMFAQEIKEKANDAIAIDISEEKREEVIKQIRNIGFLID